MDQLRNDLIGMAEYLHREKIRLEDAIPGELPLDRDRSQRKLTAVTKALNSISNAIDDVSYYLTLP